VSAPPLEVWLRGPVAGVPPVLQPVAHILLQAGEEVRAVVSGLPTDRLWRRVGTSAPIGFHVLHAAGSIDRLFTYARGETLTEKQAAASAIERAAIDEPRDAATLLAALDAAIAAAVERLVATPEADVLAPRALGRAMLPTNALGLFMHAAEHTARHSGQIVTLARVLADED
jgi:uncharacterized damage-inducible protein DinB